MRGVDQFGDPTPRESLLQHRAAVWGLAAIVLLALPSPAQPHGAPPSTTMIGGHFLGPPPTVTPVGGNHLPPPLPSVTSIPNYGYTKWYPYGSYNYGHYRGRGYGYGRGSLSYAVPYYLPLDGYGYDYVGGPDLYSGPPIGPSDPIFHMVVEQPGARYSGGDPDDARDLPAQSQPVQEQSVAREAKPNEPSVLIFRDGHEQEVSNYAIMGPTVYVFDKRTQKIALADLDVAATIKANDDRGLEFKIPPPKPPQEKNSDLQRKSTPDQNTTAPLDMASVVP